ncbi:UNVERIFIED_CONTAM: hypothetical protein Sindi_1279900 [Sesamum indicum]
MIGSDQPDPTIRGNRTQEFRTQGRDRPTVTPRNFSRPDHNTPITRFLYLTVTKTFKALLFSRREKHTAPFSGSFCSVKKKRRHLSFIGSDEIEKKESFGHLPKPITLVKEGSHESRQDEGNRITEKREEGDDCRRK